MTLPPSERRDAQRLAAAIYIAHCELPHEPTVPTIRRAWERHGAVFVDRAAWMWCSTVTIYTGHLDPTSQHHLRLRLDGDAVPIALAEEHAPCHVWAARVLDASIRTDDDHYFALLALVNDDHAPSMLAALLDVCASTALSAGQGGIAGIYNLDTNRRIPQPAGKATQ